VKRSCWRIFDKRYQPGGRFADHLAFALRHENIDLLILRRAFDVVPKAVLESYVRSAPSGTLTRRAWFFYETMTGQTLGVEDAPNVTAVDALDKKAYFTGKARLSRRHRVRDNLLGTGDYCPVIRPTAALEEFAMLGMAARAAETVGRTGHHLVARAANNRMRDDELDPILQAHSGPLIDFIEWRPTAERNVEVLNDTADLYRYFDAQKRRNSSMPASVARSSTVFPMRLIIYAGTMKPLPEPWTW
jgi:hypothetical protein